jgi:hypothetical protein
LLAVSLKHLDDANALNNVCTDTKNRHLADSLHEP